MDTAQNNEEYAFLFGHYISTYGPNRGIENPDKKSNFFIILFREIKVNH